MRLFERFLLTWGLIALGAFVVLGVVDFMTWWEPWREPYQMKRFTFTYWAAQHAWAYLVSGSAAAVLLINTAIVRKHRLSKDKQPTKPTTEESLL
jgi:hypothetical protein